MPNVLIPDLPDDVHAEPQRRAERNGQSLQQAFAGELRRLAARPDLDEVLVRNETDPQGAAWDSHRLWPTWIRRANARDRR